MNIEKFKVEETIRISYLKHGGNILKVSEELQLDTAYVKKITDKYENAQRRDVDRLVANDIAKYVLLGSEQRKNRLIDIINTLADDEKIYLSSCCHVPVREHSFDGEVYYICKSCNETCEIELSTKDAIYKLILRYNEQLREEDKLLIDFADKMGFTNKEEPPVTKVTQYSVTLPSNSKNLLNDETIKDIEKMVPAERERLRKSIESRIINEE